MTIHDDVSSITESQYCYSRANNNSLSDNDFKDDRIDALTSLEDEEASIALYGRSHHLQRLQNAYEQVC